MSEETLLSLPLEMLQQIFTFNDPTDLSALRLTCKELEAAVLDRWASVWIASLDAFMLEPARLTRLQNILQTEHFKNKVYTVHLTLDVLEGHKWDISLAPGKDIHIQDAQLQTWEDSNIDWYSAKLDNLSIDWELIGTIFATLAGHAFCQVSLDLLAHTATSRNARARFPNIMTDILFLAMNSCCPFDVLGLPEEFQCEARDLGLLSHILGSWAARNVVHFVFRADVKDHASMIGTKSNQSFQFTKDILRKATDISTLSIELSTPCYRTWALPECANLAKDITSAAHMDRLAGLHLHDLRLPLADTLDILGSCSTALVEIQFNGVCLVANGDPWLELVRHIRDAFQLSCLRIIEVCKDGPHGKSFEELQFGGPFGGNDLYQRYTTFGLEETKSFLDHIIQHGTVYV